MFLAEKVLLLLVISLTDERIVIKFSVYVGHDTRNKC